MPQSNGRVHYERYGGEGRACGRTGNRVGCDERGGDRQSGLSGGAAQACGAWDRLRGENRAPADARRRRQIRPAYRHGRRKHTRHEAHLRRGGRGQNPLHARLRGTPRRIGLRPVVHTRLRQSVERYRGRLQRVDQVFRNSIIDSFVIICCCKQRTRKIIISQ